MNKRLFIFLIPFFLEACTGNNSGQLSAKDSLTAGGDSLPFKPMYSSHFIPGNQNNVAVILNVFKAWEKNDMKVIKANFTDSVEFYFPTGDIFKNTIDSFIKIADEYFVDSLTKKEIIFYSWMSNHSVDRNEDWVNIWYKEIDTYKNGRIDSLELQDDNLFSNGKIQKVYSHMRKLGPLHP